MMEPEVRGLKGNVTDTHYWVWEIVSTSIVIDREVHKRTGVACDYPEDFTWGSEPILDACKYGTMVEE